MCRMAKNKVERCENMKKTNLTDKIIIGIVVLNLISFALGFTFYGMMTEPTLLYEIVGINFFYIIFGIPLSTFVGVMLNITSLVWKSKIKCSLKLNIWLFVILLLFLPAWQHYLWQALLSV